MSQPLATFTVTATNDDPRTLECCFDFSDGIPPYRLLQFIGTTMTGIVQAALQIGRARGMTTEQIQTAMFDEGKPR